MRQANYHGRDLPEADKWKALMRVRTGETKTAGVVDIFYMTSDEPPKCVALRGVARCALRLVLRRANGLEP